MSRAVAVLRPEPGNARTAAAIEALGAEAIRLPLFVIVPLAWTPPDPAAHDLIVATSANAFRHGGEGLALLRGLPVAAVGAATAAAARAAGFAVEAVGDRDGAALAKHLHGRRTLHLAGRDHHAIEGTATRIVYAADPRPIIESEVAALAGQVALLHSARAARRLASIVAPDRRATIRLAAISAAVADAAGAGWARIDAAPRPDDAALIALALDPFAAGTIDRATLREDNRAR